MAACPKCKREIQNGRSCQFCSATVRNQPIRAVAVESSSNARLAPVVAATVPKPAAHQPAVSQPMVSQPAVSNPAAPPPMAANATATPNSARPAPIAGDRNHQAGLSQSTSKFSPVAVTGAVLGVGLLLVAVVSGMLLATGKLRLPTSSATSSETGSEPNKANSGNVQNHNDELTPITVNKVSEVSAEVSCVPSGLEHMFEAERLQRGDIVFAKSRNLPIVVIEPFNFVGCADQKVEAQVRWNVSERQNRLRSMANDATKMLHERIGTAIKSMDIPQVSYTLCPTRNYGTHKVELVESYGRFLPPDARITRVVGGEVSIISNNDCQFDFHIREPVSQQLVRRFAITLDTGR